MKESKGAFYITILLLIALGSYIISTGDLGMGVGLIAGALGVFALKFIQNRKISQMAQKGWLPMTNVHFI